MIINVLVGFPHRVYVYQHAHTRKIVCKDTTFFRISQTFEQEKTFFPDFQSFFQSRFGLKSQRKQVDVWLNSRQDSDEVPIRFR